MRQFEKRIMRGKEANIDAKILSTREMKDLEQYQFYLTPLMAVWVTHAGGVGKVMAELLLDGKSEIDVKCFDPNRYKNKNIAKLQQQSLTLYNNIYTWPRSIAQ